MMANQLPPGVCSTNVSVTTNTNAFTLEGATSGGATTLVPTNTTDPIISAAADVRFTLTGLTFTGETETPAVELTGNGEAATITGDTFSANANPLGLAAAIEVNNNAAATTSQPTVISGDTFTGNHASSGGAIAVLNSGLPVTVSDDTFTADSSKLAGGAVYVIERDDSTGTVQLTGNTFGGTGAGEGNTSGGPGGAAYLQLAHGEAVTVSGNTFQDNAITGTQTATSNIQRWGGALELASDPGQTTVTVVQSRNVFAGNAINETETTTSAPVLTGGGAEWILGVTVNSLDDTFTGNRVAIGDGATPEGGAVGALATNPLNPPGEPGVFAGTNDLFSGNSVVAGGWGGAIYVGGTPLYCTNNCGPSTVVLLDSTVVGNSVDAGSGSEGGAIWGSPQDHLTLENSIVSGNTPQPELFGFGSGAPVIEYSDACPETGGTAVPSSAHDICYGPGLTSSGAETPISPTLDEGSNALVPAGITTDLAGNPRIRANRLGCFVKPPAVVDMGALEFTGTSPPPPCPAPPPLLLLRSRSLHDKHGFASLKLHCLKGRRFCKGTVKISTNGRHPRLLGKRSFKIAGGKTATIKVRLHRLRFGRRRSIKVLVAVSGRDQIGRRETDTTILALHKH
jgi:hypothetical protein